jgi:hypothetical protein
MMASESMAPRAAPLLLARDDRACGRFAGGVIKLGGIVSSSPQLGEEFLFLI